MKRVWVLIAAFTLAAAPGASAGGCSGDACAAVSSANCVVTNGSDKAVRLTVVVDDEALMMTVLAAHDTIRQDKALCEKFAAGKANYDARFATLRQMPPEPQAAAVVPVTKPAPRPKPSPAVASVAPAAATAALPPKPVQVASVGPVIPVPAGPVVPRFKPAPPPVYPPLPRAKPATPSLAQATPATATTPAVAAVAPTAALPAATDLEACGEACATILFKVVDDCLWVVNMHPRSVAFEADADGKRMALTLEPADGEKADARMAAVAKGEMPKSEAGVHMRLHNPFESAGAGIPLYRAKLGGPATCVKSRTDVTRFTARFVN